MAEKISSRTNALANAKDGTELRKLFNAIHNDLTAIRALFSGLLRGSATFDGASLVDAAGETTTITVTGAAVGDFALVSHGVDLVGISVTAYVSAANTVSVRFQNESGSTQNLTSSTLRAVVIPQAAFVAPAALTLTK